MIQGLYGFYIKITGDTKPNENKKNRSDIRLTTVLIQDSLHNYVEKMQTTTPQDIPPNLVPEVTQIVDSSISLVMNQTFNVLTLILLLGFITSIFLPRVNNKKTNEI